MKKILCFGDSNTFGYVPHTGERYDKDIRWTGLLAKKLAGDYSIIEAGCNNRNGFIDSQDGELFTGYKVLPRYLINPPKIVVLWIGANDIQKFYHPEPDILESGLDKMVKSIIISGAEVILISPPVLSKDVLKGKFSFQFDETSVAKSKLLPEIYKRVALKNNCRYIDINDYVTPSPLDGLHYSKEAHFIISEIIYKSIQELSFNV